ncbi:MAG: HAD family hydrolase [Verrucomicrobia bacterium]|nr:HAD family hydrolase [Verrucomicrobiota bacterium]
MNLILFDLDHTLLNGDTQSEWGCYLADRGIISFEEYQKAMAVFDASYRRGALDIGALLEYQIAILKLHPLSKFHQWRKEFIEERIRPLLVKAGWEAIRKHQKRGDELILITATNSFLTVPIAELLGIPHLIASQEEYDEAGNLTGRFCGVPSYREGKVTRLQQWFQQQGRSREDYKKILFYSDSHNDIPLLSLVDEPIIVNPDAQLHEHALKNHWKIVDFGIKRA